MGACVDRPVGPHPLYGAMIAYLIPVMIGWWRMPTQLAFDPPVIPELLRWGLVVMAVGVVVSGIRDLYAACGLPYCAWPWNSPDRETRSSSGTAG